MIKKRKGDEMNQVSTTQPQAGGVNDPAVLAVARRALTYISDGDAVGLGSGRASSAFIRLLGEKVRAGLRVTGVPTSEESARLAQEVGIPLISLDENTVLSITVDGADEVAPDLNLIKGWGGALVRERIVASISRRQVILVGTEKLVGTLGERGRIPVEIVPLALGLVGRKIKEAGHKPVIRMDGAKPYKTDNGNIILDCALKQPLKDDAQARALEMQLLDIAGVVDTGMFLGTASEVLVGKADGTIIVMKKE